MKNLRDFLISPAMSIRAVILRMNKNTKGIVLAVDDKKHLIGTVTDGDIRRAMLAGVSLDQPVEILLRQKRPAMYSKPTTALRSTPKDKLVELMNKKSIRHIPLLDKTGSVAGIAFLEDFIKPASLPLQAVVMAGGYGRRMKALTKKTPKPMLRVGGRPLIEIIVNQLRRSGIRQVEVSTHYKGEKIKKHFGDGSSFGVEMKYIDESEPLGTAGALGLLPEKPRSPLLVINGDIYTRVDFHAMLAFHQEQKAQMTVAVHKYAVDVAYGVIEVRGETVCGVREKPKFSYLVNAGIYIIEPSALSLVPKGTHYDMTDLLQNLLNKKQKVVSFPVHEFWLDIGNPKDYKKAQTEIKNNEGKNELAE